MAPVPPSPTCLHTLPNTPPCHAMALAPSHHKAWRQIMTLYALLTSCFHTLSHFVLAQSPQNWYKGVSHRRPEYLPNPVHLFHTFSPVPTRPTSRAIPAPTSAPQGAVSHGPAPATFGDRGAIFLEAGGGMRERPAGPRPLPPLSQYRAGATACFPTVSTSDNVHYDTTQCRTGAMVHTTCRD